ncbi:MAG: hypothetical protein EPN72_02445 [Nevskiaceae bacterium]|nr:MAG: hypothetical protein EPN63_11075 [Nevskiaceae bacterium]TBR74419.1 MAG: hypothetical protein EPN72_02445 [Nevskiaceae bacterium]
MADDAAVIMQKVDEPGMGVLEVFPLPTDEATLHSLLADIFTEHWQAVRFGPLIQGAAYEIAAPQAAHITLLDGYITVDFGVWHLHLCIGEHHGTQRCPTPPELARHRRTARAEFYRIVTTGAPTSWGLRLFNGAAEQQINVMLPNPFLTEQGRVEHTPDWSRLAVWDRLRERYLSLAADPRDRTASRFYHP